VATTYPVNEEAYNSTALSAKQDKVVDLLVKGRSVKQIARTMKIKPSGVYGHIRRLRELGVIVDSNGTPAEPSQVEGNGVIPTPEYHDVCVSVIKAIDAEEIESQRLLSEDERVRFEVAKLEDQLKGVSEAQIACCNRLAALKDTREAVGA
jgi:DNA-binding CsgD family transcriptional regulator